MNVYTIGVRGFAGPDRGAEIRSRYGYFVASDEQRALRQAAAWGRRLFGGPQLFIRAFVESVRPATPEEEANGVERPFAPAPPF